MFYDTFHLRRREEARRTHCTELCVVASQILTVQSAELEANWLPSELQVTAKTPPECPPDNSAPIGSPVLPSYRKTCEVS